MPELKTRIGQSLFAGSTGLRFRAVDSGNVAFLVNSLPIFVGLAAFDVNPLPAD
jgi:hypothetical protein